MRLFAHLFRLLATRPFALTLALLSSLPGAALAASAGPFGQGKVRVSLGGALGFGTQDGYFVVGGGVGYYLLDGLELGVEVEHWFGAEPEISKLSPEITYTFYQLEALPPYVGAFYRHWFIGDDRPDLDTVGVRAGAVLFVGRGAVVGIGGVYERVVQACRGDGCDSLYPELAVGISF